MAVKIKKAEKTSGMLAPETPVLQRLATRNLVFEIFVDRFAASDGSQLPSVPEAAQAWEHHCGGTLDGIVARMPHLDRLGVELLYLTPIFRATTNHKYNTASFHEVDPAFGGDAAFNRLAAACRERGMGLILDGVFNHVGRDHEWFNRARRSRDNGENGSSAASYFKWSDAHPDKYDCWRGHGSLPELELGCDELQQMLFHGENAVVREWLRRGATGWRLDCANDLGTGICSQATAVAMEERATDGVIGEVMSFAEAFAQPKCLSGVMNYYFRETVLRLLLGDIPAIQAAANFDRMVGAYGWEQLLHSWNVLSTHDTPRLATLISDARQRRFAFALAFSFPGVPFVFYGEAIGMQGGHDPDCRAPMVWDETQWDTESFAFFQRLGELRKARPALQTGRYVPMPQPGRQELLVFARVIENDPGQAVLVVANASDKPADCVIFAPYTYFFDALPLRDLLGESPETRMISGCLKVQLQPWSVALYYPDGKAIPGYDFFKR